MLSMSDIRDKFGFVNPDKVEEYLGNHPQLIDHLVAAIPVIRKHLPEAGTLRLNHIDLGCLDGELMLHIHLPDNAHTTDCRRRLSLIDDEWWVPLPANVKSLLLADIRWNQDRG
jgi:hypothetical protein